MSAFVDNKALELVKALLHVFCKNQVKMYVFFLYSLHNKDIIAVISYTVCENVVGLHYSFFYYSRALSLPKHSTSIFPTILLL